MFAHRGPPDELVPSKLPKFYFVRSLLGKLWGSFKASHNLLLAFFFGQLFASLQSFASLERFASLESFGVPPKSFPQFAFGVLYFESFAVPSKLPKICFWRSLLGQLFSLALACL